MTCFVKQLKGDSSINMISRHLQNEEVQLAYYLNYKYDGGGGSMSLYASKDGRMLSLREEIIVDLG